MPAPHGSHHHFLCELASTIDLAKRPQHAGQKQICGNYDVLAEAEGQFVVALGIEYRKRPLEVGAGFHKFSFEPIGLAAQTVCDTGLARFCSVCAIA